MEVDVHYIFSRNKKIGSKLIIWGTKHLHPEMDKIPSHGAVLINDRWVLESTLDSGVRVISYQKWLEINEEIYKIESDITDYTIIKNKYKQLKDKKYDWPGIIYQAIHLMMNKFFKKPVPKKNKWQSNNKYFCLEVIGELTNKRYEMETPVGLVVSLME